MPDRIISADSHVTETPDTRLMWANDFPHSDATWPHSQEMLREHTAHLSGWEKRRILHDNVAELYGLGDSL